MVLVNIKITMVLRRCMRHSKDCSAAPRVVNLLIGIWKRDCKHSSSCLTYHSREGQYYIELPWLISQCFP